MAIGAGTDTGVEPSNTVTAASQLGLAKELHLPSLFSRERARTELGIGARLSGGVV